MTANNEGSFGAPPANAPHEVSSKEIPRSSEAEMAARREAAILRAEERGITPPPAGEAELEPFAPPKLSREAMRAILGKDPEQVNLGEAPKKLTMAEQITAAARSVAKQTAKVVTSSFKGPDIPLKKAMRGPVEVETEIILTDGDIKGPLAYVPRETPPAPLTAGERAYVEKTIASFSPPQPHQRAASNTDSPSRGIPTPIPDEGKKITGGFGVLGDGGEAQYYPLDGTELRAVVLTLMDDLARRIEDDLRFSIACTYPRAHVRVMIEVDAYGQEKTMEIPKVMPPHVGTPLEVAKRYGDQIVFVVIAERQEMTPDGQSVTPPNRMRQEAGLTIPHKQAIDTPSGRQFVDIP